MSGSEIALLDERGNILDGPVALSDCRHQMTPGR